MSSRIRIARFLIFFVALLCFAVWASHQGSTFRDDEAIRFDQMSVRDVVLREGLSRRQLIYSKIGYVEAMPSNNIPPYQVGIFGSHQIKYFSSEAFGYSPSEDKVFNFWAAANRMHDMANYLEFLAELGQLPDMIFLAIATPNNDNGGAILGGDPNMPITLIRDFDSFSLSGLLSGNSAGFVDGAVAMAEWLTTETKFTLNYINFFLGMFGGNQVSLLNLDECAVIRSSGRSVRSISDGVVPFILSRMPQTLRTAIGKPDMSFHCRLDRLQGSTRADGSSLHAIKQKLIVNQRFLNNAQSELQRGDEFEIESIWIRIHEIVRSNGKQIIYFSPPVYETERHGLADRVFDATLDIMREQHPEIYSRFIDDRYVGRSRPEIFYIYDHPNPKYYDELVQKALDRGLLPESYVADSLR